MEFAGWPGAERGGGRSRGGEASSVVRGGPAIAKSSCRKWVRGAPLACFSSSVAFGPKTQDERRKVPATRTLRADGNPAALFGASAPDFYYPPSCIFQEPFFRGQRATTPRELAFPIVYIILPCGGRRWK